MKHIITFAVIHFFFLIAMLSLSDEKIDFKNKKIYIGYIFTLILLVLNFELSLVSIRVVLNIIIYVILAQFLFAKGIKESILLGMSVTVIGIFSEIIYGFLAYPMLNQTLFVEEAVLTAIINNFFIGIILVFLCSHKPFKNLYQIVLSTTNKINDGYIMVFSLLIIIIFNFICWISYFVFKELLSHYYLLFISSSLSIFGFLLVFFYFKANNKYLTVYEKYNISLDSIREFELMIENYRINTHENKNQFRTIRNMSKNKKINSYIDALLNENVSDDEKILMASEKIPAGGLRGIIYSKLLLIQKNGILFEFDVDKKVSFSKIAKIDDYTLTAVCRILGVLLDNAIEGVSTLDNKYIMIELYEEDNYLVISITNNYEGYVDIENINNSGITKKGKNHGYGLALVQRLVKRHKKIQHSSEFFEDNFMQKIKIKV